MLIWEIVAAVLFIVAVGWQLLVLVAIAIDAIRSVRYYIRNDTDSK